MNIKKLNLIVVAMFFIAVVCVSLSSCTKDDIVVPTPAEELFSDVSDRPVTRANASIPYLSYYSHLQQSGNTCGATSYVIAMDMLVDYTRNAGYHNQTYSLTGTKASAIDTYIRNNYSSGDDPNVGNLQNYFFNQDRTVYPHTNVYYNNSSSSSTMKQYIINNLAYNIILVPVVIRSANAGNATSYDGSAYANYPENVCYVVDETINNNGRWGHFLILTGIEQTNGVDIVRYRDCLESSGVEKKCTLDRLLLSNKRTSSYNQNSILLFQHI
ncbi:MAG: hypothetical protein LBU27_01970 [Candidatus Peribacteria bacterium]|jgi:hypothetical protein|nr:hypothetical protein [Candidatus Peribacteria bacterium]